MTTKLAAHARGRCRASPGQPHRPCAWAELSRGYPMFKFAFRSSICLAAVAASSAASAEDTAHAVAADGDSIIVTATRAPLTLDEVPSSIAVLDKQAIDRAQDI